MKTKPCDRAVAAARLGVAEQFVEAAEFPATLAGEANPYRANAQIANYVQAGIAAADAICCVELREHSSGDDHALAIDLMKQVTHGGADLAKALAVLLGMKTPATYGSGPMKAAHVTRAQRAAEKLVRSARDRVGGT